QSLTEIRGVVTNKNGQPLAGVTVVNKTSTDEFGASFTTVTDQNGRFKIRGRPGDELSFSNSGFAPESFKVGNQSEMRIELFGGGGGAVSPLSTWIGAKIGYNLDGITEDNSFIGAAKVIINPLAEKFSTRKRSPSFAIIGNFADFISNTNKDSVTKQLTSLTQSVQGLGIGLGLTWDFPFQFGEREENTIHFRPYLTSSYRLNTFTKVGPDSSTVNLSQMRNTIGLEFEGLTFKKGGAINLSIEASLSLFGASRYQKIFNENKSSLRTLEATLILPISNMFGLFVDGTYSRGMSAVYLIGIIIKPESPDSPNRN
ncbi:MAG TPA: carboxypeptidase-like regulatory domain-containing protein, partial [Chitinophagaceae bacterium]|nr:carboxypeptidase-like regulatory domain-containing protein [Chitinophagaceae bacterium]